MNSDPLKPILFYHGDCPDGFGAALAFWIKYHETIEYIPVFHKKEPFKGIDPVLFHDRQVWMVDIALEREDLISAHRLAKEFIVLDHHLSNQKHLADLSFCHFDMHHSGAVLAWQYLFPDRQVPKILQYIEDRDIHTWKLPYAQELLTAVDAEERTLKVWQHLSERIEEPTGFAELLEQGAIILRYNKTLIEIIKREAYVAEIKGHRVPMINTPFFRSEIVNDLSKGELFAAGYHYDGENFIFSLRSEDDGGINVEEIAEMFPGGGGHFHAAGFSVKSLDELK